jgi:squalene-hopene/tetraprenyl-beta-curcumene cyclase
MKLQRRIDAGTKRGLAYLLKTQQPDGAWPPLWFGNQHADEVANLTYGTSRVLRLAEVPGLPAEFHAALHRGAKWLVSTQNADGGWGGRAGTPSGIEETALAVEGLAVMQAHPPRWVGLALNYLSSATRNGTHFPPSPIGFYFANLWYFEKLYPVIYTVAALTRVATLTGRNDSAS